MKAAWKDLWSTFSLVDFVQDTISFGLFKFSLLASLPIVILVAVTANQRLQQERFDFLVRQFIQNQAAANRTAAAAAMSATPPAFEPKPDCYAFDPLTFDDEPSIATYFPNGRLGNAISAFLMLLWVRLDHGLQTFMEKEAVDMLSQYFVFGNSTHKVLEEDLCDWQKFGFRKFDGNVEDLGGDEWASGKAIQIFVRRTDFMRIEVQGGRKYYTDYRKQSLRALTFKDKFASHARITLKNIAKKVGIKSKEITFVGVHNRRTDYLDFRRRVLKMSNLYEDYFEDATSYFVEEYGDPERHNNKNVVFVFVSDDMKWGRRKLKHLDNVFFAGCGDADNPDCIGKDLALLASCNHTIVTHGSFSHWAAFMAGGEIYTEYGSIVPSVA